MSASAFTPTALRMFSGALVWALHFTVVYGGTGLACARGTEELVPWLIGAATAVATLACAAIIVLGLRRADPFERWLTTTIAGAALLAIVWEALPVLWVPPCV